MFELLTPAMETGVVFILCAIHLVAVSSIKFVGVPQPKPMHGFSPNFQAMFNQRESRADSVYGEYLAMAVLSIRQPKPIHGFSLPFRIYVT